MYFHCKDGLNPNLIHLFLKTMKYFLRNLHKWVGFWVFVLPDRWKILTRIQISQSVVRMRDEVLTPFGLMMDFYLNAPS